MIKMDLPLKHKDNYNQLFIKLLVKEKFQSFQKKLI